MRRRPRLKKMPRVRGECQSGPRPCPFRQCRYHLDNARGETCALDVADRGRNSSREVGRMMDLSRQQASRIEQEAMLKLVAYFKAQAMDLVDEFTGWLEG